MNLQVLFNLPPKAAIQYLESKGYQVTWDWYELMGSAHARAFTVAKATSRNVLEAFLNELKKALQDGLTFEQFRRNIQPRLVEMGWWGKKEVLDGMTGELTTATLGTYSRLRTIFQTNMQTTYMAARYQRFEDNKNDRPYLAYIAVEDGRTRPEHWELYKKLRGKVIHIDDPIWDVIFPPNGWGCRCRTMALSLDEVRRLGLQIVKSLGTEFVPVVLNKDGDMAQVQSVSLMGNDGKPFWFRPDPGWDYNPGKRPLADLADELLQA